jgi:hypothetical protein
MSGTETVEVAECLSCERPCTNSVLQSAYLNVFRGRVPGEDAADIRLLMQNCDQYDTCVPSNLYDLERAQHLFILGMTDKGKSNAHIGWQTGNASNRPIWRWQSIPITFTHTQVMHL